MEQQLEQVRLQNKLVFDDIKVNKKIKKSQDRDIYPQKLT